MIRKVISLFFLTAISGFFLSTYSQAKNNNTAQQEFFPFVAEVISDNLNIRAGQSENFEKLAQLNKGDQLYVAERSYSWYKIRLPEDVAVYISRKYLDISRDKKTAMVNADRINLRSKKTIESTIVGQVEKGEIVSILSLDDEWAAINPTPRVFGWVKDSFVKFKSKDVSVFDKKQAALPEINAVSEKPPVQEKLAVTTVHSLSGEKDFSATGYLERKENSAQKQTEYILFVDDKPAYTIVGDKALLNQFLYFKVRVKGRLDKAAASRPVLHLSKIELVY